MPEDNEETKTDNPAPKGERPEWLDELKEAIQSLVPKQPEETQPTAQVPLPPLPEDEPEDDDLEDEPEDEPKPKRSFLSKIW